MRTHTTQSLSHEVKDKEIESQIEDLIKKLPGLKIIEFRYVIKQIIYKKYEALHSEEIKKSVMDKIEPYIKANLGDPDLKGIYAWFLEKKMRFCKTKEEENKIYNEILSTYQSIFDKYPKFGSFIIRINYLNFLSRHNHEDCIVIAKDFLNNADTFTNYQDPEHLNTFKAKICNVIGIECEKKTSSYSYLDKKKAAYDAYEKMNKYADRGINYDSKYAPLYSLKGKYYYEKGNFELSDKNYDEAMRLNQVRFAKNHPLNQPSQKKITSVQQTITTTTTTTTTTPAEPSITTTTTTSPITEIPPKLDKKCEEFELEKVSKELLLAEETNLKKSSKIALKIKLIEVAKETGHHLLAEKVKEEVTLAVTKEKHLKTLTGLNPLNSEAAGSTPSAAGNSKASSTVSNSQSVASSTTSSTRAQNGLSANASVFTPRLSASASVFIPRSIQSGKEPKEDGANELTRQQSNLKK